MAISSGYDLIQNLMSTSKSGTVSFSLPKPDGSGNYSDNVVGCLVSDVSMKLANKWQAVLPNIDPITLASSIVDSQNAVITWIRSTQSAWMGSEPLRITLPFYLFSMNSKSNITEKANRFRYLSVPYQIAGSEFRVITHGGYKPTIIPGDNTWITGSTVKGSVGGVDNDTTQGNIGFITIKIGDQCILTKMLLEDVQIESSQIQVADGNPLYVKVVATFKSHRVLYSQDIKNMFPLGG
jgi:hypothetical protein